MSRVIAFFWVTQTRGANPAGVKRRSARKGKEKQCKEKQQQLQARCAQGAGGACTSTRPRAGARRHPAVRSRTGWQVTVQCTSPSCRSLLLFHHRQIRTQFDQKVLYRVDWSYGGNISASDGVVPAAHSAEPQSGHAARRLACTLGGQIECTGK